jgi:hypothetical protein
MNGTANVATGGDGSQDDLSPAALLGEVHALRERAGAASRGYWLPLLLFGAASCGALAFYQKVTRSAGLIGLQPAVPGCTAGLNHACHSAPPVHLIAVGIPALSYYWQLVIPAVAVLAVLWYRWRADRIGLRTPTRGFLIAGLVLAELVLLVSLVVHQLSPPTAVITGLHDAGSFLVIAALLWVLAWAERSRALAVVVAVYLAVALVVGYFNGGGLAGPQSRAADVSLTAMRLLGLLPALVLLAAGTAAWISQRLRSARRR